MYEMVDFDLINASAECDVKNSIACVRCSVDFELEGHVSCTQIKAGYRVFVYYGEADGYTFKANWTGQSYSYCIKWQSYCSFGWPVDWQF